MSEFTYYKEVEMTKKELKQIGSVVAQDENGRDHEVLAFQEFIHSRTMSGMTVNRRG